jgi:uncharacterized membrane protein YqjE
MNEILKFLWILQEKKNSDESEKLFRLNPYNPLSYIVLIIFGFVSLFLLIILIIKESVRAIDLFKWF